MVSLTWRGPKDFHATAKSTTKTGYLRWGTSIQIPRTLVRRVELFWTLGGEIHDYYSRSGFTQPPGYMNVLKYDDPKSDLDDDLANDGRDDYQDYDDEDEEDYNNLSDEDYEPSTESESEVELNIRS